MKAVFAIVLLMSLILPWSLANRAQDPETGSRIQDPIPIPQDGAVERRDFMRTKLLYTQNIFEGLTIRDFDLINRGVKELEQVLEAEQWVTIDHEGYRRLVEDFRIALNRVKKSAETKNIEATAFRFYEMSTRCIDCHQQLHKGGAQF